jgi:hypothetical protein
MVPALVNAAFGGLLAAALLGPAFDRRTVALVVGAAVVPDLGSAAGVALGWPATAAVQAVWLPLLAALVLLVDTRWRERSVLRARYGWRGVRVAWVALASASVAGVAPDLFGTPGVPLLYPLESVRYTVDGLLLYSTQEGVVQTLSAGGATPGVLPLASTDGVSGTADGRPGTVVLVETGWQAVVVATGALTLSLRLAGVGGGRRGAAPTRTTEETTETPETTEGTPETTKTTETPETTKTNAEGQ